MSIILLDKHTSTTSITDEILNLLTLKVVYEGLIGRTKEVLNTAEIITITNPDLLALTDDLVAHKAVKKAPMGRWDSQYRELIYQGVTIKLFLTGEDNYGYQRWIRTGPENANHVIFDWVKEHSRTLQFKDDYLYWRGKRLAARSEREMFDLLGLQYIPPNARIESVYRHQLKKWWAGWPEFSGYVVDAPMQLSLFEMQS